MDRALFLIISLISIVVVFIMGDPLYLGVWYYIIVAIIAYFLAWCFKVKPLFLTGCALAILFSYIPYFLYNMFAARPEGLIGLGHLFSLPGLALGILFTGSYLKNKPFHPAKILVLSLLGVLLGFIINQIIVCNSVLHCSGFIWPISMFSL